MITNKKYLVGVFDDEHTLIDAFECALEKGVTIEGGLYAISHSRNSAWDEKQNTHQSCRIFYGLSAVILLLSGMYYAAVIDWPLHFGGKTV